MDTVTIIVFGVIIALIAIMIIAFIMLRTYQRASKEISFVRTGAGGQKVIMNGGAFVLPVLHEIIPVNMNTLRLEVQRANNQALITRDRMRVDVMAEFYVRVKPTSDAIADAAQTLGRRTMDQEALKELVEGKFVDALRAVAAEMAMEELHEQRVDFVQKVQSAVTEDLLKNGLELESVSLTALDQTDQRHFNPQNAFDARGLTTLTEEIQARLKQRNDIEKETELAIRKKNLITEKEKLLLDKDEEYARLEQQQEIAIRRAEQQSLIAREESERTQQAEDAKITAKQKVDLVNINAEQVTEEQRISKDLAIKEKDIERVRAIETAEINSKKSVELSDQDRAIALAEKSKEHSMAQSEAAKARALAVKSEEQVDTARQIEIAERQKGIELIEASKQAERQAIGVKVAAEAEKQAADDKAEALRTIANGDADKIRIAAQADAEAEMARADAAERRYAVEAEGKRALHEAENLLNAAAMNLRFKLALIDSLADIIRESVKPMEAIEGIKIINVAGLNPGSNGSSHGTELESGNGASGNLADQLVNSALRYRGQAPLVDALMKEVGLAGDSLNGMTSMLHPENEKADKSATED